MPIYLDHNATSPLRDSASQAMARAARETPSNASSVHDGGVAARFALESARAAIAECLNCAPDELVFTSGGTEANHLAIDGVLRAGDHIVASAIEHPAVAAQLERWSDTCLVTLIRPQANGVVAAAEVVAALRPNTRLVALMHTNNETGAVQPVAKVALALGPRGIHLHCDAVQAAGKAPLDVGALGASSVAIAAHKFGGPLGVGALWVREGVALRALRKGGGHERGLRPGTLNVPGACGMAAALAEAMAGLEAQRSRWAAWRSEIVRALAGWTTIGDVTTTSPNTLCVLVPRMTGQEAVRRLSDTGVWVSAGSACAAGRAVTHSATLAAMGLPLADAQRAIRVSMGWSTTEYDIAAAIAALRKLE